MNPEVSRKISFLSLVAAILVVCIHVPRTNTMVLSYLAESFIRHFASCAVPFFLIVSGYLLGRHTSEMGWYGRAVKKRMRSVLVPYLIWCVILGVAVNASSFIANIVHHQPLLRYINLNPIYVFGLNPLCNPAMPLWYLRELMLLILVSGVLWCILPKRGVAFGVYFVALLIAQMFVPPFFDSAYSEMFSFTVSFANLAYFSLGMYLSHSQGLVMGRRWGGCLLFSGVMLMILITISHAGFIALNIHLARALPSLAICLVIVGGWRVSPAIQLPSWLSSCSFPIYLMHVLFLPLALAAKNICPRLSLSIVGYLFFVCLFAIGSVLIATVLRRSFPRVASVVFGGR